MEDDMLESMKLKNGNIYDDSDSICEEEHEMDYDT